MQQEGIRRKIVEIAYTCGKPCHVGSSLSMVDILAALFGDVCREQDELILSKGHAAMAWYAALAEFGYIDENEIHNFEQNDSAFSVLAVKNETLRLKCSTGSLGQGISVAVGMAIAMKRRQESGKVYVIIGNGEANEGSVWEAALLARQCKLDNLVVIVDHNCFQSDGSSASIIDMSHMKELWNANGFCTSEVNGHNREEISEAILSTQTVGKPTAIVCHTIKGYGVSFMENSSQWHHNRLGKEQYELAIAELGRKYDF